MRVNFVPCEGSGVRERHADVLFFEIRQLLDDLRRHHAVGDEVEHVREGNTQSADRRTASRHVRVLRDPIECVATVVL